MKKGLKKWGAAAGALILVACGAEYMSFFHKTEVVAGEVFPVTFECDLGGTNGEICKAAGAFALHVPDGWAVLPDSPESHSETEIKDAYEKLYAANMMTLADGETWETMYEKYKNRGFLMLYRYADAGRTTVVDSVMLVPNSFYTDLANSRLNAETCAHFNQDKTRGEWWGYSTAEVLNWGRGDVANSVIGMRIKYNVKVADSANVGEVYRMDAVHGEAENGFAEFADKNFDVTGQSDENGARVLFRQFTFKITKDDNAFGLTKVFVDQNKLPLYPDAVKDIKIVEDPVKVLNIAKLAEISEVTATGNPVMHSSEYPLNLSISIENTDLEGTTGLSVEGYRTLALRLPAGWNVLNDDDITEQQLIDAYDFMYTGKVSIFGEWPEVDAGSIMGYLESQNGESVREKIGTEGAFRATVRMKNGDARDVLMIRNVCVSNVANHRYSNAKVDFAPAADLDADIDASASWVGFSTIEQLEWSDVASIEMNLSVGFDPFANSNPSAFNAQIHILSGSEDFFRQYEGYGREEKDKDYATNRDRHIFDMGTFNPNDGGEYQLPQAASAMRRAQAVDTHLHSVRMLSTDLAPVVSVDQTTSVNLVELPTEISVMPMAGGVKVAAENGSSARVYTIDGRLAASAAVDGEATIALAKGIYAVAVNTRSGKSTKQIVVVL